MGVGRKAWNQGDHAGAEWSLMGTEAMTCWQKGGTIDIVVWTEGEDYLRMHVAALQPAVQHVVDGPENGR